MRNIQQTDPQEVLDALRVKFDDILSGLNAGDLGNRARAAMEGQFQLNGEILAGDPH